MLCVNFENDFRKNLSNRSNRFHHHVKKKMNKLQRKITTPLESMVYGPKNDPRLLLYRPRRAQTYPRHLHIPCAKLGGRRADRGSNPVFSPFFRCSGSQRCCKPASTAVRATGPSKRPDQVRRGETGLIVYVLGCARNRWVWPQMPALSVSLPVGAGGFGVLV